jgi:DNA-binding transcriptional LysR family regulator
MPAPRVLTPEALEMLAAVAEKGSFASAAQALGLVPSAVTYRVRQLEEALDVLLFDRSSRRASLTDAGRELLSEGARILADLDAVANRVKRVATGWEPQFTIAVETIIAQRTLLSMADDFLALGPPTQLKLQREVLSGTMDALASGQADLALGVVAELRSVPSVHIKPLGDVPFVFAVAPHHALAHAPEPLTDAMVAAHRAIAVADSTRSGNGISINLLPGQRVLTVYDMQSKLDAQLRGMGCGSLPLCMAQPYLETGRLIEKRTERPNRTAKLSYAWRGASATKTGGRALRWWLDKLADPYTQRALLHG